MTVDVSFAAVEQFLSLSKAMKNAGQTELRKDLHRGVAAAVKPLLPEAQQALAGGLPASLAARGSRVKQVVQVRTGNDPGVTVGVRYGKRGTGLGASNARMANLHGVIRHPLFGDREHWFNTRVPGAEGWFDRTYGGAAPRSRAAIEQVMEDTVRRIIEEARHG